MGNQRRNFTNYILKISFTMTRSDTGERSLQETRHLIEKHFRPDHEHWENLIFHFNTFMLPKASKL